MFLQGQVWSIQNQTGRYILKILLRWKSKRAHERRCVVMRDAPSLCVKKEVGNFDTPPYFLPVEKFHFNNLRSLLPLSNISI